MFNNKTYRKYAQFFFSQKDASALLLPQQEQHMDDVFSATCVGSCGAVCTSVHGSVSVVHGVHSVQNVLSPDGGFQRVFCEVCAHLQNVSDSVAELDAPRNPFDDSDELCAHQEKQLRKGFQPGEQKRTLAPNPGAFPSGGKSGDFSGGARGRPGADLAIWPNLAPRRLF